MLIPMQRERETVSIVDLCPIPTTSHGFISRCYSLKVLLIETFELKTYQNVSETKVLVSSHKKPSHIRICMFLCVSSQ